MTSTDNGEHAKSRFGGLHVAFRTYQQIGAVLGAVAIAAMLSHLSGLDWRGVIANIIGYWDQYARPLVGWLLDSVIATPVRVTFGWQVEFPLLLKDYIAVGIILVLSTSRARIARYGTRMMLPADSGELLAFVLVLFLWPLGLLAYAYALYDSKEKDERLFFLYALSPIFYLALLFAVNYLLLQPEA